MPIIALMCFVLWLWLQRPMLVHRSDDYFETVVLWSGPNDGESHTCLASIDTLWVPAAATVTTPEGENVLSIRRSIYSRRNGRFVFAGMQ